MPLLLSYPLKNNNKKNKKQRKTCCLPSSYCAILFIKFALRLPYRQTEGLSRKIFGKTGIPIPNFRTLHYRFSNSSIDICDFPSPDESPDDFVIVLDSSGLKVTNRSEWLREKHGILRRGWVKIHIAFDVKRKRVIEVKVTDEKTHDSQKAQELVESTLQKAKGKKPSKVIADAGYDNCKFFHYLHKKGISPAILVRKNARIRGDPLRDDIVRTIERIGRRKWKEKVGYGTRWVVESFFSLFKRWFSEALASMKFDNMQKEVIFKTAIMNMFLSSLKT